MIFPISHCSAKMAIVENQEQVDKLLEIKKDIIEHLWKILISDNTVDQYESNLMRRICGLIYFSDKESAEIKLNLLNSK